MFKLVSEEKFNRWYNTYVFNHPNIAFPDGRQIPIKTKARSLDEAKAKLSKQFANAEFE